METKLKGGELFYTLEGGRMIFCVLKRGVIIVLVMSNCSMT